MSKPFIAKRPAICASPQCNRRIRVGQLVIYVDDQLRHEECAMDGEIRVAVHSICPDCFMERSTSGGCGCW